MTILNTLKETDSEIYNLINDELSRQQNTIELIASENFTSCAVMEACGSVLTNKYAEGKPYKRFYNGCEVVDKIEEIAQKRAKKLFGAQHVNVQPHSGAQANMAVFLYALKPGDTVLGMDTGSARVSYGVHPNSTNSFILYSAATNNGIRWVAYGYLN